MDKLIQTLFNEVTANVEFDGGGLEDDVEERANTLYVDGLKTLTEDEVRKQLMAATAKAP